MSSSVPHVRLELEDDVDASHRSFLPESAQDLKDRVIRFLDKVGLQVLHGRPRDIFPSVMSGVINAVMLYCFSAIFSKIIFTSYESLLFFVPEGVSLHLIATILSGIITICFSKFVIAISCPDINPVLLFLEVVKVISNKTEDPEQLLPTVLTALFINTMGLAVICLVLGYTKQTRLLQFVPATVMIGFLGIIGYKVTKEAFEIAAGEYAHHLNTWNFWKLALSGLSVGGPLYFCKRYHIGDPVTMFIIFLFVPMIFFYIMLRILGMDIEDARESGWFLEEYGRANFYSKWKQVSFYQTNTSALSAAVPTFFTNWIITSIDFLLKMAGIKRVTEIDASYDRETKLIGYMNLLTGACFSSPAYPQMKWTALNLSIIRNVTDRFPSVLVVVISLILYLSGFPLVNYLPRFFLSGLLFYAGLPFLFENLFDSYWRLSRKEFCAVWVIVLMSVFLSTLIAVSVGIALATIIYVMQSARQKVQKANLDLTSYQSKVTRSLAEEQRLEHLGSIGRVIWLKHYLFFGSASKALEIIKELLDQRQTASVATRLEYLALDFEEVDGIDYSALAVFLDISKRLYKANMKAVVFTGLSPKLFGKFTRFQVLDYVTKTFPTVDEGVEFLEERVLAHYTEVRRRWLSFECVRMLHERSQMKNQFLMLDQMLGSRVSRELWLHVKQERYEAGTVICKTGEYNSTLYLVQLGRVTLYSEVAGKRKRQLTVQRGAFVNEQSLFSTLPSEYTLVATTDCALLTLTPESFNALAQTHPFVAIEIQRKVMQSASVRFQKVERELLNVHNSTTSAIRSNRRRLLSAIRKKLRKTETGRWLGQAMNRLLMFNKPMAGDSKSWQPLTEADATVHGRGGIDLSPMEGDNRTLSVSSEKDAASTDKSPQKVRRTRKLNLDGSTAAAAADAPAVVFPTEVLPLTLSRSMDKLARAKFRAACAERQPPSETLRLAEVQTVMLEVGQYASEATIHSYLPNMGDELSESNLITLLRAMTMKQLDLEQQTQLLRVFVQFNGSLEEPMSSDDLMALMHEIGNPLEEEELMEVLREWAPQGIFQVSHMEFLGIMATYMMEEDLDSKVQDLFYNLSNATGQEQHIMDLFFTAEDVMRVFHDADLPLTLQEADEMVFDSAPDSSGEVNFDDWWNSITSMSEASISDQLVMKEVRMAELGGVMPSGAATALHGSATDLTAPSLGLNDMPLLDLNSPTHEHNEHANGNRAGGNLLDSPTFLDESTI
eukprot:m.127242 g.127242  ORF g.127242 m.127242 type:complete len:1231 (-) comp16359_c0_seq2:45-3737(-)